MRRLVVGVLAVVGLGAVAASPGALRASTDANMSPAKQMALYANGWSGFYRWPFGAAATGSTGIFRLRSSRVVTSVTFYLVNEATGGAKRLPMSLQFHNGTQDFWRIKVTMPEKLGQHGYYFKARSANGTAWYGDDSSVGASGRGQTYTDPSQLLDYELTIYQSGFTTPSWLQHAVIYEIFPDRFFDGDTSNDSLEATGTKYGYIDTIFHNSWDELPVENSPCPDPSGYGNNNCDFFGGDLQGVIDKLPYLHNLGITAVYLTPIFLAPSNHKYDTSDFMEVDPEFGTLQTFQTLATDAKSDRIHLILDGAFEDTGSYSVYFDKYGNFQSVTGTPGACDSTASPYYNWYTIFTSDCSLYKEWFGIQTLPSLNDSSKPVEDFIFGNKDSVAQYWINQGASGWRLDSADQIPDPFWQGFRQSVKALDPNAAIIGEDFSGDPTFELLGNEWDGSMNYRFRDPVLDFFAKGIGAQNRTPMVASSFMQSEMGILSEVPWQADLASMNIVDSQDTERILSALKGNIKALKVVSLFQMTWPGVPAVYYGDEAGLLGLSDPDNRRTFPWDHQNTSIENWYTKIIHLREGNKTLSVGHVVPLLMDDKAATIAYERQLGGNRVVIAINDSRRSETVTFPVDFKDGTILSNAIGSGHVTVRHGQVKMTLPSLSGAVLLPVA